MAQKINIGITGQSGFIGTHLYNFLGLQTEVERIPFKDAYFDSEEELRNFVAQCDVVIHLAAVNRHEDQQVLYDTNVRLVEQLIDAMERTGVTPHVLMSSSSQEDLNNLYGKSKKEGREKLAQWAEKNNALFSGLVIPNVFGPFGLPYYNSVVATFCHQLTHNETPQIHKDAELKLIYIGELVNAFWNAILQKTDESEYRIPHTSVQMVSDILERLVHFREFYLDKGVFPEIKSRFDLNLFNTFRCYIDHKNHYPVKFVQYTDERGAFVETIKTEMGGQFSFSTTKPGITRGNHFHTRKIERFAVIKGKARIQLRRIGTERVMNFDLDGNEPAYVDMPVWYTHNITNIGEEVLLTLFWINEFFDAADPDTFFEEV